MKKEYGYAMAAVFFWGTMAPVGKELLAGLTNMEVLGYGSGIAAVTLLAVLIVTGQWKELRAYRIGEIAGRILLGAMGYFLYSALYYQGLSVLTAQTACVLNYLWPIFTVCFSALILREKLSKKKLAAILLSFAGVAVILFGSGTEAKAGSAAGSLCCIGAAVLYGLFNVLNKRCGKNQTVNMFLYIATGAVLALLCCAREGFTMPLASQIPGLLWLGVFVDAAAYLLWAIALQRGRTEMIAGFAYLTPAISFAISVLFYREPVQMASLLGLACILAGVLVKGEETQIKNTDCSQKSL